MNKRYEEGRKPFFSDPGENERKQYVWAKDENGKEYLQETAPIDIQAEIESYTDECDIKNIVRKASFDPEFLKRRAFALPHIVYSCGFPSQTLSGSMLSNWPFSSLKFAIW